MLQVEIPGIELYDETSNLFMTTKTEFLQLEHSLVSLSKWESKWCKPFLSDRQKTTEETIDYVRCMTITQNVNPAIYMTLTDKIVDEIDEYIEAKMTATWFTDPPNKKVSREVITAEIIYYWMIAHNIPLECQKWHLNRLLTLIRVCNIKGQPAKKVPKKDMLRDRATLNATRKAQLQTKG